MNEEDGPPLMWEVLAFKSTENLQQLKAACVQVGSRVLGSEVTPSFRYVVYANRAQMDRIAVLVPWANKYWEKDLCHPLMYLAETSRE